MKRAYRSSDFLKFRALLRDWEKVVDHYGYRRRRPQPVSSQDYPALHTKLLGACRKQLAEASNETDKRALQHLVELIGPWVTLESLTSSRTQILTDLSAQCLAVEYALDGGKCHTIPWATIALVASVIVTAGLAIVLVKIGGGSEETASALVDRGLRALRELMWKIRFSNFLERFAAVTVLVVVIGILLLTKGLRKWT
jgi:hypothetical protein